MIIIYNYYKKYRQYFNFAAAGIATAVIDILLLTLFVESFKFNVITATIFSQAASILLNYILSTKYVFGNGKRGVKKEILMVYILSGVGFFLNIFLMWLFVYYLGIHYIAARIISICINVVINFQAKKRIIFVKM